jgi:effector-binding domain-containing protein
MLNKQWPYFILVFVLPLLLVFWWWGAFTTPVVENLSRPALHYAYLISEGDYSKVEDRQHEVRDLLKQQGIVAGQAITLIEDDPRTTPGSRRRAQAGIMIAENTPALKMPLMAGTLPERRALVVSARAHPFLAYGKAYGALLEYIKGKNIALHLPVAETTHDNTLTIEMAL